MNNDEIIKNIITTSYKMWKDGDCLLKEAVDEWYLKYVMADEEGINRVYLELKEKLGLVIHQIIAIYVRDSLVKSNIDSKEYMSYTSNREAFNRLLKQEGIIDG